MKSTWFNFCKRLVKTSVLAVLLLTLSTGLSGAWWDLGGDSSKRQSALPQGNAITDPNSLLMYALPIENDAVRQLQQSLEDIAIQLRGKRWSPINSDLKAASRVLDYKNDEILEDIPEGQQTTAETLISDIKDEISQLRDAADARSRDEMWLERRDALNKVSQLEELMVTEFPFEVPEEYSNLPQLKGRARVAMETEKGDLTMVVDGYSAPVTAGNFVDLVQRGFYDGLTFDRAESSYVLQTGNPPGEEEGFIDPKTGEYRAIPLEILVQGEEEPLYGVTMEEMGLYLEQPALPFSAYGTVAMARPNSEPNGGSSQFFFLLFDTELTPPGYNLLDGRYAVFGYVVEGEEVLDKLTEGDKILSAKVVDGLDNFQQPSGS